MTNKETFIVSVLGVGVSLQLLSATSLPKYDKVCMDSMKEAVELNMDYSEDLDWQAKQQVYTQCFTKYYQNILGEKSDVLLINLSDEFTTEIEKSLSGGEMDRTNITKYLMKYHYQIANDYMIERPNVITKLFGTKSKIVIDDRDTTYEETTKIK